MVTSSGPNLVRFGPQSTQHNRLLSSLYNWYRQAGTKMGPDLGSAVAHRSRTVPETQKRPLPGPLLVDDTACFLVLR